MPDLLAHALVAYALFRVLSVWVEWMDAPYVTAGMAGAFVPDLAKVKLLVSSGRMEALLGIPFSWTPLATAGGAALCVLVGVALVDPARRWRTGGVLAVGAATHLLADALLLTPSGRSYAVLWPLTRYNPPTPGLYLSTRPEPTIVAGVAAGLAWLVARHFGDDGTQRTREPHACGDGDGDGPPGPDGGSDAP